jgi:hypothetical protein
MVICGHVSDQTKDTREQHGKEKRGHILAFMAKPLTVGLMFNHRLRPALPNCLYWCMMLLETPIVAQASLLTLRISPLCSRTMTCFPVMTLVPSACVSSSLEMTVAYVPALRQKTALPSDRDPTL